MWPSIIWVNKHTNGWMEKTPNDYERSKVLAIYTYRAPKWLLFFFWFFFSFITNGYRIDLTQIVETETKTKCSQNEELFLFKYHLHYKHNDFQINQHSHSIHSISTWEYSFFPFNEYILSHFLLYWHDAISQISFIYFVRFFALFFSSICYENWSNTQHVSRHRHRYRHHQWCHRRLSKW